MAPATRDRTNILYYIVIGLPTAPSFISSKKLSLTFQNGKAVQYSATVL